MAIRVKPNKKKKAFIREENSEIEDSYEEEKPPEKSKPKKKDLRLSDHERIADFGRITDLQNLNYRLFKKKDNCPVNLEKLNKSIYEMSKFRQKNDKRRDLDHFAKIVQKNKILAENKKKRRAASIDNSNRSSTFSTSFLQRVSAVTKLVHEKKSFMLDMPPELNF